MSGHGPRASPVRLLQGAVALALVIVAFVGLQQGGLVAGHGGPLFALGFLVIAGTIAGEVAGFFGLPRLTGYLLAGVLSGPQGLAFFSAKEVKDLGLINVLALALIALQAGAEITISTLRRTWKSVLASSSAQVVIVIPAAALAFYLAGPYLPFAVGLDGSTIAALALVWGVVLLTRSPSVTLALLAETRAKGPLSDFALGVVVLLDVIVLPLFAVAMSIAKVQILGDAFEIGILRELGAELFASSAAGVTFGLIAAALLRLVTHERVLVIVVLGYGVTALATYLRYDVLLVFVVAGFVVQNLTKQGHAVIDTSERIGTAVMVVFFATAGAKLDLASLRALWPLVIAFFALRVGATVVSAKLGHRLAKDPPSVRRYGWMPLVSQAGVTIGLASIVADTLPGVGRPLASLMIAVVGLNELVGPVLFKLALQRAGELPSTTPPEDGEVG